MSEFYALLGVARNADDGEIKKAYRRLAMEYHPDRNRSADAEAKFKEITEAYEVLRDPQRRASYDRYGRAGVNGTSNGFNYHHVDLSEALNIFMRDFGGLGGFESLFGGDRRGVDSRRGQDVKVAVRLTLEEVATGAKKALKLKLLDRCGTCAGSGAKKGSKPAACQTCSGTGELRRSARSVFGQFVSVTACPTCAGEGTVLKETCEVCRGDGRVKSERTVSVEIPAGVSSNNYLTLRGQGASGPRGGPPGDLIVLLEVLDDERFERHGDDLLHDLQVSFSQAALGASFRVPTPYGEDTLVVPSGTQSGTVLRIRGKGMPRLGQNGFGDLHVRVQVWTPERLAPEQERLMRELAQHEGEPPQRSPGFWQKVKEAFGG